MTNKRHLVLRGGELRKFRSPWKPGRTEKMADTSELRECSVLFGLLILAVTKCLFMWVFKIRPNFSKRSSETESDKQLEKTRCSGHTLDLDGVSPADAKSNVADFMEEKERDYSREGQDRYCYVITGQGNRTVSGPTLGSNVEAYLNRNGYRFSQEGQGKFKVDLHRWQ
ncbi:hypothetical protein RRG08_015286 [Elysia crispata]|uniref:Smr domain-containing protein n=1 Tax=Elysia crispata TaxID=231223 RepID=A0AAE1DLY0_9GAST|nr:hypothetical protein RRG08_015286 [Elysia crispata]